MRYLIAIIVTAFVLSSCSMARLMERKVRRHPERYVGVINALKDAASGGDTVAARLAAAIMPDIDTVVIVRRDTVVAEVVDTAIIEVPVPITDTVVIASPPIDTVVASVDGRARVRLQGNLDSMAVTVEAYPVVTRTRVVTVVRDSVVKVPEVRYVSLPSPSRRGIPWWLWAVVTVLVILLLLASRR